MSTKTVIVIAFQPLNCQIWFQGLNPNLTNHHKTDLYMFWICSFFFPKTIAHKYLSALERGKVITAFMNRHM